MLGYDKKEKFGLKRRKLWKDNEDMKNRDK